VSALAAFAATDAALPSFESPMRARESLVKKDPLEAALRPFVFDPGFGRKCF
jgi:hypothetical protein